MKPKKDLMPFTPDKTPSKSPLASGVGEACCEGVDDILEIEDVEDDSGMDALPEDGELTEKPTELSREDMKKILAVLDPEVEKGGEYTIEDVREVVEKLHSILDSTNEALSPECYDDLIDCKCEGDKKCGKCKCESYDDDLDATALRECFYMLDMDEEVSLHDKRRLTESKKKDCVNEAVDMVDEDTSTKNGLSADYVLNIWKQLGDNGTEALTADELNTVENALDCPFGDDAKASKVTDGDGSYTVVWWNTNKGEYADCGCRDEKSDIAAIGELGFEADYDNFLNCEDAAEIFDYDEADEYDTYGRDFD